MLHEILSRFACSMQRRAANGFVSSEWITDGYWIDQRWLHGTVWGALAESTPEGLMPIVEPGMGGFRPDIVFINKKYEKVAIIEYESSNSSDERLIIKDIFHYVSSLSTYKGYREYKDDPGWMLPKLWVIISTLPSCEVVRWPWHGYNNDVTCGPALKCRKTRDQNPLAYYEESLHAAFGNAWKQITSTLPELEPSDLQLAWVNLDQTHVRVMNVNGRRQKPNECSFALF